MKHSAIANVAVLAALETLGSYDEYVSEAAGEIAPDLYAYLREHGFPPPETLARKAAKLEGRPFPGSSLDDAPEPIQAYFITFHAVCKALDRFHEPDDVTQPAPAANPEPLTDTGFEARTKAAQAETDKAIAESGGKLSSQYPALTADSESAKEAGTGEAGKGDRPATTGTPPATSTGEELKGGANNPREAKQKK